MEPSQVSVIKEWNVRLAPLQHCLHGGTPCAREPHMNGYGEAVFWSIPDLSGQEPARDWHQQGFEPTFGDFAFCRNGENAVEYRLVKKWNANF